MLQGFTRKLSNRNEQVPHKTIDANLWATFIGWYISEGSCDYRKGCYRIRITQNNGPIRDKMRRVLGKLPVNVGEDKNGFFINNEQIWKEVEPLGKAPQKYIPEYIRGWSQRLLTSLLSSLMEGDGDINNCYYTSSKKLANDVTEIALKLGCTATMVMKSPAGQLSNYDKEGREIRSRYDQWKVSVRDKRPNPCYYPYEYKGVHGKRLDGSKFPHTSEWVDYDGEVFCAEVPNHLLIVRRNGKPVVSGNSMAGVAMRRAITNLMSPTGEMRDLLYDLNIQVYDAVGIARPFIDVFGDISDKVNSTSTAYRNMVFEVLFGRRALAGMITVFNFGKEALREYADELEDSAGMMESVTAKQMAAFSNQMGQIWQQTLKLVRAIGKSLVPTLRDLGQWMKGHVSLLTEWVTENEALVVQTMKLTTAFGLFSLATGGLLIVLPNIIRSVGLLATAFTTLILPIGAVVVAFYAVRAAWDIVWTDMSGTTVSFGDWFVGWAQDFKVVWKEVLGVGGGGGTMDSIYGAFKWMINHMIDGWMKLAAMAKEMMSLSTHTLGNLKIIAEAPMIDYLGSIEDVTAALERFGTKMADVAREDIKAFIRTLRESVPELSKLLDILWGKQSGAVGTSILAKPGGLAGPINESIATEGKKYSSQFAENWASAIKQVMEDFSTMNEGIKGMLMEIRDGWANAFADTLQRSGNFKDKMLKLFDDMFDAVYQAMVKFVADMAANSMMAAVFGPDRAPGKLININPQTIGQFMKSTSTLPVGASSGAFQGAYDVRNVTVINTNTGPPIAQKVAAITQDEKGLIIQTVTEEAGRSSAFKQIFRE